MTPGPRTCLLGGEGGRPVSPWQPRGPTRPYGRFLAAGGSSQEGGGGDARVEGDGGAGVQAPPSRWEPPSPPRRPSVPSAPPRGCRRDGPALVCACMLQGRGRPPARWRGRPRGRAARGPARGKDEEVGFGGGGGGGGRSAHRPPRPPRAPAPRARRPRAGRAPPGPPAGPPP